MSQHDMSLANATGASYRSDCNNALVALVSCSSGATEPATMFAYQLWADTTAGVLKQRNALNSAWITLFTLANGPLDKVGGNMSGGINSKLSVVASATTPDIFATTVGNVIDYTGTATCTGFVAAPQAGAERMLVCGGASVFTAGANMLIDGTPSGNFTAAAGDKILVVAVTTSQFRLTPLRASGAPAIAPGADGNLLTSDGTGWVSEAPTPVSGVTMYGAQVSTGSGTSFSFTSIPAWARRITIDFAEVSTGSTTGLLVQIGDAGGIETGSYVSFAATDGATRQSNASGFLATPSSVWTASELLTGRMTLELMDESTNRWLAESICMGSSPGPGFFGTGVKSLSQPLTQLLVLTTGGATFDNGHINVKYE